MRAFEAELKPHQLAAGGDGLTVLARAVIEHNLAAASTLYANITLPELARLLGIAPDKAERMAAAMIAEGRLRGSLDQPLGLLTFERAAEAPDPFDARITQVSLAVQNCVDVLKERGLLVAPATVLA